jgi:hypothetical protein
MSGLLTPGAGDSQAASSASQDLASSGKRSNPDVDIDELFKKAERTRKVGKKAYWQYVHTVKTGDTIFYRCKFCNKDLSIKNPHDSVANHIILSEEDGATCKVQLPKEKELRIAREQAAGTFRYKFLRYVTPHICNYINLYRD